jgi:hypothetical protein
MDNPQPDQWMLESMRVQSLKMDWGRGKPFGHYTKWG